MRHAAHFGPVLLLAGAAFLLTFDRTQPNTPVIVGAFYGAIVALNVLALALSTWSSVLGLLATLAERAGWRWRAPTLAQPTGRARTAILMPVHEEDAARVFAAIQIMAESLVETPIGAVDVFVLSDTRTPAAVLAERTMHDRVRHGDGGAPRIFYRHRAHNTGRKAGNIAEFVTRWGAAYDFMIVLDADSLMTGAAMTRLVGAMEANPRAGLIQAMCYPAGRSSLFAKQQQFNARLYGPLFQRGVAWWQGPRGNFWGHNAILRTAAFAANCGLPTLRGRAPFGGHILSHDTVEAALMLRGGFDVWMLPDDPDDGSWEEAPTNLLDHLARDRRWCRGNLQHGPILAADGLRIASRYHLARGLLHYLYAPLILIWLVLYATIDRRTGVDALALLVSGMIALPRLLGLGFALADGSASRAFGGRRRLLVDAVLDQILIACAFPVTLAAHLATLAETVTGSETLWHAQVRDDRNLRWRDAASSLAIPLGLGLVGLAALAWTAPFTAALLALGLFGAVPLAVVTSRSAAAGLFAVTPEETRSSPLRQRIQDLEKLLRCGLVTDAVGCPPTLPPEAPLAMPVQRLRRRGDPARPIQLRNGAASP